VHEAFGLSNDPGLSSALQGAIPVAEAIHASDVEGLSIMTAGSASVHPGDLLERPLFGNMLNSLKSQYDWIVIDSPPVMAGSDAMSLAHVSMATVFVVGAQMTSRRNARAALDQLEHAQTNVIGAVLSRGANDPYSPYNGSRGYKRYHVAK
jgi:Mrp family chromosome partitioning ATPase